MKFLDQTREFVLTFLFARPNGLPDVVDRGLRDLLDPGGPLPVEVLDHVEVVHVDADLPQAEVEVRGQLSVGRAQTATRGQVHP